MSDLGQQCTWNSGNGNRHLAVSLSSHVLAIVCKDCCTAGMAQGPRPFWRRLMIVIFFFIIITTQPTGHGSATTVPAKLHSTSIRDFLEPREPGRQAFPSWNRAHTPTTISSEGSLPRNMYVCVCVLLLDFRLAAMLSIASTHSLCCAQGTHWVFWGNLGIASVC